MDWKIPLSDLSYDHEEKDELIAVLRSRWLAMGKWTQEFERSFANTTHSRHAFAVANGTAALHLACLALGIGPGDEVICPSLTFVATANAVLYTGATPVFADIRGPYELTIDPDEIERRITPRTRAIMVMHYGGYPCRMEEVMEIARQHGLAVIEDAAHAPGAWLGSTPLGAWGDVGCFSFFSNKNLITGEGGMIVTDRDDLAEKIRLLRSHGMTTMTYDRHKGHASSYDVLALGYNYRLDEIHSALGIVQLRKLTDNNQLREAKAKWYRKQLQGSPVIVPFAGAYGRSAYHLMAVLLPEGTDRKAVMEKLKAQGIQTSIHYPPVHLFSYYRERFGVLSLPRTEEVAARELTLPLYPGLTTVKVDQVCKELLKAL